MHYLDILLALITHHPVLAYGAVFLVSLSESLALVGLFIPGTVVMFGVGAIVATGSLGLVPVLVLAAAGAIAGDGISYWLGRRYKETLRGLWPFSRYSGMLDKGEVFFRRHGGKSVLLGRFIGPIRPVIPVVAGMLGMGPVAFAVVNVLSAIGWSLGYIMPGVLFGTSLAVAGTVSTRLAVLVFMLVVTIWAFIWLGRKLVSLVAYTVPAGLAALEAWAARDATSRGAVRRIKHFLSDPRLRHQGEHLFFAFLVLLLLVAGWGFFVVLEDVLARDPLALADQSVYRFFQSVRISWWDDVFVTITELGDAFVNTVLISALVVVLLAKRCYRAAGFLAATAVGGMLVVQLLKWVIHLPRPVDIYHGASAFSFPSGHATMSVICYGFLAILLARGLSGLWRWGLLTGVFVIACMVGISRLYLGAHWLSDVVGGIFFGATWVAVFGIAYLKGPGDRIPRRLLVLTAALVILIAGGWHVFQRHDRDLAFYAPQHKIRTMSLAAWQDGGWRLLPAGLIDMTGSRKAPLSLQWAGSLDALARYLLLRGWQYPTPLSLRNALGMLSPDTPIEKLPTLPRLHRGRPERLRLVYRDQGRRWVLRLWPADATITETGSPVFLGTITEQRRSKLTGLISAAQDTDNPDLPLSTLGQMLQDRFSVKLVSRADKEIQVNHENAQLHRRGRVLLVWEKTLK
ncbi:MAG: VTT domain-containing protein [Pseudomonadota bacterium]